MDHLLRPSGTAPGRASFPRVAASLGLALILLLSGTHSHSDLRSRRVVNPTDPADLTPLDRGHQDMLLAMAYGGGSVPAREGAAFCWSEGTPPEIVAAFDRAARSRGVLGLADYADGNRWSVTAADTVPLEQGDPTTLTWGILPDGVEADGAPSELIWALDSVYGEGPGGSDLTQRPWFPIVERALGEWSEVVGVRHVYEPNDDGAPFSESAGVLGVRPDIRIAGVSIDGTTGWNIYGYNYFPDNGDMVLDTDNRWDVLGLPNRESLLMRNLIAHEHGHGVGLGHSCPENGSKLMEPTIWTQFDGPQEDDILWAARGYGDSREFPEQNDDAPHAFDLGTILPGDTLLTTGLSLDGVTDQDYFAFTVTGRMRVTIRVTPTGTEYWRAEYRGELCTAWQLFDAKTVLNLDLDSFSSDGITPFGTAAEKGPGGFEQIPSLIVPGAGTYFVRIYADDSVDDVQRYELELSVDAGTAPVALCKDREICRDTLTPFQLDEGSYDPDGDPIQITLEPPGPYPPGETLIRFIVDDGALADTCEAMVTVNAPPVGACRSLTVQAESPSCPALAVAPAELDDGSLDPEGKPLTFALDPPGPFPPGTTLVDFLVTDACNATDTCRTMITVECQVPVRLLAFRAERRGDDAVVHWETAAEAAGARFHVYREEEDGLRRRRTDLPLSGLTAYEFTDSGVPSGALRYWLEETDRAGVASWHGPLPLDPAGETVLRVAALAPNPFAAVTALTYSLPTSLPVRITVYDVRGRRVRLLADGVESPGSHRAEWNGTAEGGERVAAGLYLMRVETGRRSLTRKVVFSP